MRDELGRFDPNTLLDLVREVVETQSDLRHAVSPKTRFDERFGDLQRCLALDGYAVRENSLWRLDPSLQGAPPVEDDLLEALRNSTLSHREDIRRLITNSAGDFCKSPPDLNGALTNARVALETIARDIAFELGAPVEGPDMDAVKWGRLLVELRDRGEFDGDAEKGLAGVYRFLSPGAHRPLQLGDDQIARLGRTLALNMCWFLVQLHLQARP
ncbi:MAG: hypothetical protein AB7P37_23060 [Ramlibacter sp.]